jgi:hypothetical protein
MKQHRSIKFSNNRPHPVSKQSQRRGKVPGRVPVSNRITTELMAIKIVLTSPAGTGRTQQHNHPGRYRMGYKEPRKKPPAQVRNEYTKSSSESSYEEEC